MKKGTVIFNANKPKNSVDVLIYGYINDWGEASGKNVAEQIAKYDGKYKYLNIYLNTNGGSVTEGIAIFNILRRSNFEISITVEGVAASMGAVLLQLPSAKRYMAKYTRVMMHQVSGFASGNVESLRETADMMESFEDDLVDIIGENTGFDSEEVKTKWFNGKNNWLTPQEALDEKLIDGIVDGKITKEPGKVDNLNEAIDFYGNQITNFLNQNNDTMDLTKFINALNMQAGASEEQILNQVKKVTGEVDGLKAKVIKLEGEKEDLENAAKDQQKAKVKAMIDNAIKVKKITEEQRPVYEALAATDFENAEKALEAIPVPGNLRNIVEGAEDGPINGDRKSWTFQDWQKKDGKGLENLKAKHTEAYDALYNQAFPKEG